MPRAHDLVVKAGLELVSIKLRQDLLEGACGQVPTQAQSERQYFPGEGMTKDDLFQGEETALFQ